MIDLGTIYLFLTGTLVGFLNRMQDAVNQTLQVFSEFAAVTEGEIHWVAVQLGYQDGSSPITDVLAELAVIEANQTAILAAIAALPDGSAPVILPTTPPSGYGSGSAADVWDYVSDIKGRSMGQLQLSAASFAESLGLGNFFPEFRGQHSRGWIAQYDWTFDANYPPDNSEIEALDPTTVLSTDATLAAWLARVYPGQDYFFDDSGYPTHQNTHDDALYRHPFGKTEFALYQAARFGTTVQRATAPIWPGLALVTLLDAVPLAEQVAIDAPMHGCLIFIDGVPTRTGKYVFGEYLSYQNAGAVTFVSDEAVVEAPQPIGLNGGCYNPKTMAIAAGVRVRSNPAFVGTVQPWIITE